MNQMKLITDSRDKWTLKELLETLHAKVDDLERKLDARAAPRGPGRCRCRDSGIHALVVLVARRRHERRQRRQRAAAAQQRAAARRAGEAES